jgi:hypothetical protein
LNNFKTLIDILIKDEVNGIQNHERNIVIGDTPDILQKHAGFSSHRVLIKASTISKIHFDHGISTSLIHRIPELLNSPKSIFKSATHPDSAIVFTFEIQLGSPVLVVMQKDKLVGRDTFNICASMYPKEGEDPEKKWERDGLLLWKVN